MNQVTARIVRFGVKDLWNSVESFPNLRYKGNTVAWEYYRNGSKSLVGTTIYVPYELNSVFLKLYY